jgi:hypothetical protein
MDLNLEHKLKLMSECEEASQQVKYQERRGGGARGRGEERRGKPHVEVVLQKLTSSKPVRAVAMGLLWVKGQSEPAPMLVPLPF